MERETCVTVVSHSDWTLDSDGKFTNTARSICRQEGDNHSCGAGNGRDATCSHHEHGRAGYVNHFLQQGYKIISQLVRSADEV